MDLSFLKQVVPTIATALGGPLAGVAAGFIADKLGVSDKTVANISGLVQSATQSPETLIELKKIDNDLKKYYEQVGVDIFALEIKDRDSARNREILLKDIMPKLLGSVIVGGFFMVIGLLVFKDIPSTRENIIMFLLGSLSNMTQSVMSYYFGSTKGSSDKTAVMAATINTKG